MKTIYTKPNCPGCVQLKKKLYNDNEAFTEVRIGTDITREEFMQKFPTVKRVPHVVENPL